MGPLTIFLPVKTLLQEVLKILLRLGSSLSRLVQWLMKTAMRIPMVSRSGVVIVRAVCITRDVNRLSRPDPNMSRGICVFLSRWRL